MSNNHPEYNRKEVQKWGRAVIRLRNNGSFKDLLSAEIKQSPYTLQDIAESLGITRGSISKWKSGESYPAVHLLWRLCQMLHPEQNTIGAYIIYTQKINAER